MRQIYLFWDESVHRGIADSASSGLTAYFWGKRYYVDQNIKFSRGEEIANAVSHLLGTILAVVALVLMVHKSARFGNPWHVLTASVFGASMIVLYLSSTLTHILPMGRTKDRFFNFDRIAIYFLIAGTYTPISLMALGGPLGWVIFGIEWGLALTGTFLILKKPGDYNTGVNVFYVASYAAMGWLILIAIIPLMNALPWRGTLWILLGGLCYTLGIVFFKMVRFPYHHLVWHLLVLAGTASHFFAVFFYVIPS